MIASPAFAGKSYAVYGLARSGLATVEALLASGATVMAWDEKEEAREELRSSRAKSRGAGTESEQRPSTSADRPKPVLSAAAGGVEGPG